MVMKLSFWSPVEAMFERMVSGALAMLTRHDGPRDQPHGAAGQGGQAVAVHLQKEEN